MHSYIWICSPALGVDAGYIWICSPALGVDAELYLDLFSGFRRRCRIIFGSTYSKMGQVNFVEVSQ